MVQIIKNVKLINGDKKNIVIKAGKIFAITDDEFIEGSQITLPNNVFVSTGWIDLHTHAFPKFKPYCSHPDEIGYETGVTTVVDAGSSGADNIDEFFEMAETCKTNVLSFLNVSKIGLKKIDELADISNISFDLIRNTYSKYPDKIVGLKARMSASVIGDNGIVPLQLAKEIADELGLPTMVHIGSAPPSFSEIISLLEAGDVVTHCFNEKENNHIFSNNNKADLINAVKRGVYLDIGHGTSSFSFDIAKRAKEESIDFDSISTDIYEGNQQNGPVYNMAVTLTKFLALGYSLEKVIKSVTEIPAKIINKPELGELKVGAPADLTFFTLEEEPITLTDSLDNEMTTPLQIKAHSVLIGGKHYVCK